MDETGHRPPASWSGGRIPAGREDVPATYVSWHDARAFADRAGGRLPTEAEWEAAATGGDGHGLGAGAPDGEPAVFGAGIGGPSPAGRRPARPCGALDMAGNVAEWVSSTYRPYPWAAGDGREDPSSHSASVGAARPASRKTPWRRSRRPTSPDEGRSPRAPAPSLQCSGARWPVSRTNPAYWSFVTAVSAISNPGNSRVVSGSSSAASAVPRPTIGSRPIRQRARGTSTRSCPVPPPGAVGEAEADVGVDGAREQRVAVGAANGLGAVDVRAAANDPRLGGGCVLAAVARRPGVRAVGARHPLGHVSGHVERAEGGGRGRQSARRRGPADAGAAKTARSPSGGTSPQGQSRPSPPGAAASHSASVGSLPPAQSANARASCQET